MKEKLKSTPSLLSKTGLATQRKVIFSQRKLDLIQKLITRLFPKAELTDGRAGFSKMVCLSFIMKTSRHCQVIDNTGMCDLDQSRTHRIISRTCETQTQDLEQKV